MLGLLMGRESNGMEIIMLSIWEQVKWVMVESAKEVCSSVS